MEKLKAKHNHKLTDILKVAIFGIFLLLPFIVYAPNAFYYGFNEHAKNETTTQVDIQYKYKSNEVNSVNDLLKGNIYNFNCNNATADEFINIGGYLYIKLLEVNSYTFNTFDLDDYFPSNVGVSKVENYLEINNDYSAFLNFYLVNTDYTISINLDNLSNETFSLQCVCLLEDYNLISNVSNFSYTDYNVIENVDMQDNVENTITESMNTAWQNMWATPMFNWTNESVLKQGLDNFTGVFGVSDTSYFTNLIVYELIMVAIYIVIDIILTMFKWLTHLIGEK